MEAVGFDFAVALAFPKKLGVGGRSIEFHHHRPLIKGGDEKKVSLGIEDRLADREAVLQGKILRPERLAGLGVQRSQSIGCPDDELFGASFINDHRRSVTRVGHLEGAPDLLAGVAIERDETRVAGDEKEDFVAVNQRMGRHSPGVDFGFEVLGVVLRPDDVAGLCL